MTPKEYRPGAVYAAAKMESERQAWKWIQENEPSFTLNTVLPSMTVSPPSP